MGYPDSMDVSVTLVCFFLLIIAHECWSLIQSVGLLATMSWVCTTWKCGNCVRFKCQILKELSSLSIRLHVSQTLWFMALQKKKRVEDRITGSVHHWVGPPWSCLFVMLFVWRMRTWTVWVYPHSSSGFSTFGRPFVTTAPLMQSHHMENMGGDPLLDNTNIQIRVMYNWQLLHPNWNVF